jgi:glycosyltransferase involved in cell wall biosynthesis
MSPPSPLRILMTTDAVGGVWFYASELACALCERGDQVLLVILGPPPKPELLRRLLSIEGLHLKITDLELEWLDPQASGFQRARHTLLRLADEFQPDLVHLNSFREAAFDWPAPLLVVAHSCVNTWWRACHGYPPDEPRWETYRRNVAAGLRAADAWAAPTAAFRNEIAAAYQPLTAGFVIRNGISFKPRPAAKAPLILAGGRFWDQAKNLKSLTAIAPELPWPVRVAGPLDGPDGSPGIEAENVTWLGELSHPDLFSEMSRSEIFVAPALYEPFGLTVLEAAACGCALVLSDLASFRELWGDAAIFVDPRNSKAISAALQLICTDQKLRQQLQVASRTRAKLYSLPATAMGYRQLYWEMRTARKRASVDQKISVQELRA